MGMGADMCEWMEETGYEGDDPFGAWVSDLTYRASGGFCIEDIEAQEARGLKWNQGKRKWLPAHQNENQAEEMPKKKVPRTGTDATCSVCKRTKPQADFSKRQWNTKGDQVKCISCLTGTDAACSACKQNKPHGDQTMCMSCLTGSDAACSATCSACKQKKPQPEFSKTQWARHRYHVLSVHAKHATGEAQARCMACIRISAN